MMFELSSQSDFNNDFIENSNFDDDDDEIITTFLDSKKKVINN